jgi:Protein of unknown function (DUF3489)
MEMFLIDANGKITAVASGSVNEGEATFTSERELGAVTAEYTGTRLVEIWNQLPGVMKVRKFTDRKTAVSRIWKAVQGLEPVEATAAPQRAHKRAKKARSGRKASQKPGAAVGGKTATLLDLLRREGGATLEELMKVTGWQAHSVRGFISGTVNKRMGLQVVSAKPEDGKRTYSIAG